MHALHPTAAPRAVLVPTQSAEAFLVRLQGSSQLQQYVKVVLVYNDRECKGLTITWGEQVHGAVVCHVEGSEWHSKNKDKLLYKCG